MNLLEVQEYGSAQAFTISQKTTDPNSNTRTSGRPPAERQADQTVKLTHVTCGTVIVTVVTHQKTR
jgi:hypothetical protein